MQNENEQLHYGFIYKYIDKNKKIYYIGKTKKINQRHYQHLQDEYGHLDMYYFQCDIYEIDLYEALLIKKYKPKYNKQYLEKIQINPLVFSIEEPEWILWTKDNNLNRLSLEQSHLKYIKYNKYYKTSLNKQGRPRQLIDRELFDQSEELYKNKQITRDQQIQMLGIGKTKFYKIIKNPDIFFEGV